ncbi:MAG: hypothetical protein DMF06_08050 [Verrucomicrobia bacterium]|jgi:hypothetical protein|nr:MAG: hypothetical protein DMF06_08050 [Verrucomicrobiota bacterium]
MKIETGFPRRRFLASSALAACALLVPRVQGKSRSAPAEPTVAVNEDDQAVIAELAAYSSTVYLWGGPANFPPHPLKAAAETTRFTKFLVLVNDFERLALYLISEDLEHLGVVYAGGPHLAFVFGTTAFTVTNYGARDFNQAIR